MFAKFRSFVSAQAKKAQFDNLYHAMIYLSSTETGSHSNNKDFGLYTAAVCGTDQRPFSD